MGNSSGTRALYQRYPSVLTLDGYSSRFCRCLAVECLVWSYVVVVDALAVQDRGVCVLYGSHDFRSFLECSVISFRSVVVEATLQAHARDVTRLGEIALCRLMPRTLTCSVDASSSLVQAVRYPI